MNSAYARAASGHTRNPHRIREFVSFVIGRGNSSLLRSQIMWRRWTPSQGTRQTIPICHQARRHRRGHRRSVLPGARHRRDATVASMDRRRCLRWSTPLDALLGAASIVNHPSRSPARRAPHFRRCSFDVSSCHRPTARPVPDELQGPQRRTSAARTLQTSPVRSCRSPR